MMIHVVLSIVKDVCDVCDVYVNNGMNVRILYSCNSYRYCINTGTCMEELVLFLL